MIRNSSREYFLPSSWLRGSLGFAQAPAAGGGQRAGGTPAPMKRTCRCCRKIPHSHKSSP
jgi:hypothetical protein